MRHPDSRISLIQSCSSSSRSFSHFHVLLELAVTKTLVQQEALLTTPDTLSFYYLWTEAQLHYVEVSDINESPMLTDHLILKNLVLITRTFDDWAHSKIVLENENITVQVLWLYTIIVVQAKWCYNSAQALNSNSTVNYSNIFPV